MFVTVFRSRLKPTAQPDYAETAARMSALARQMPGYVSHKVFIAEDGERVTLVEFETEEAMMGWARHPEHVAAKQQGRASFYSEYSIQICEQKRAHVFRPQA
ncbi:MAG: antibiotic biosynthesis monooxygenase [Betaproteobacteria bacterium]|nr:antibiotic biosynthesis monooxygenase [Betaproteobacteria bacterium]